MQSDIQVFNGGSIVTLTGLTTEGIDWLDTNLDPTAMRLGTAYVVEWRYADPIIEGAMNDGLILN